MDVPSEPLSGEAASRLFSAGLALHRDNRLTEAAEAYERALQLDAEHFDALYHASILEGARGDFDLALEYARRAVAQRPSSAPARAQAGSILAVLLRHDEALVQLKQALELDPERPEVLNNVGGVLRGLGRPDEALAYFERAVALAPGYATASRNLGNALTACGRYERAVAHFEALFAGGMASADFLAEFGKALWRCGRTQEGIARFEQALALDPSWTDAWGYLGNALVEEGRLHEAAQAFLRAITCAPRRPEFYRFLAETSPSAVRDEHVSTLQALCASDISDGDLAEAHYALGKILAERSPRQSFDHFREANSRARKALSYEEAATLQSFEHIAALFDERFIARRRGSGYPSELPVFIFGMPRSGTTLVEQILASHPHVYGGGELATLEETVYAVVGKGTSISAGIMAASSPSDLYEVGKRYATSLASMAPAALRVTDKMPSNFRFAGLVALALPNARMIHTCRDPIETCISCFSNSFLAEGLAWTCDLAELGRYCRAYLRLMEHWRRVLPGAILEVRYEELVEDFEAQACRIVAHCGLDWDDRCARFYETRRPIKTASAAQVRRPIYRSALRRAPSFGNALQPLIDALGSTGAQGSTLPTDAP